MLNPRCFLEDCVRNATMSFWSTGLPWGVLNSCIDDRTFDYDPGEDAKRYFEAMTGLCWNNLHDPPTKTLDCPSCLSPMQVPWTEGQMDRNLEKAFENCSGYADKAFLFQCSACRFAIDHDRLKVLQFRKDVEELLRRRRPLPGTLFNIQGVINPSMEAQQDHLFPNYFIPFISQDLLRITDPRLNPRCATISSRRRRIIA